MIDYIRFICKEEAFGTIEEDRAITDYIVYFTQRVDRLEVLALLSNIVVVEHLVEFYVQSSLYLQIGCQYHASYVAGGNILCGFYTRNYGAGKLVGGRYAME